MSNNTNNNDYKSEIQVAISALIASLGFFKTQELKDFIGTLKASSFHNTFSINIFFDKNGVVDIFLPFIGLLLYFGYLICVGRSLICIFRQKPAKQHQISIFYAVGCYFALQFLLIAITFADKPKENIKLSKNVVIQMDSLYLHIPCDSITTKK